MEIMYCSYFLIVFLREKKELTMLIGWTSLIRRATLKIASISINFLFNLSLKILKNRISIREKTKLIESQSKTKEIESCYLCNKITGDLYWLNCKCENKCWFRKDY